MAFHTKQFLFQEEFLEFFIVLFVILFLNIGLLEEKNNN